MSSLNENYAKKANLANMFNVTCETEKQTGLYHALHTNNINDNVNKTTLKTYNANHAAFQLCNTNC